MEDKVKAFLEAEIAEKQAQIAKETEALHSLKTQLETEIAMREQTLATENIALEGLLQLLAVHKGEAKIMQPSDAATPSKDPSTVHLKEPWGYRNIAILLARVHFQGGSFTTREMVKVIKARKWKADDDDWRKSKNVTAVLSVEADFVRVSRARRDHEYRLADVHLNTPQP